MNSGSGRASRSSSCFSWIACGMAVSSLSSAGKAGTASGLQVTIHEVDLLQPAKALADVLRTDLPHSRHGLELRVRRGEQLVEAPELVDDLRHHEPRQPRDAAQDPVAARGDRIVKRVDLAVEAQQLGHAPEVDQVL